VPDVLYLVDARFELFPAAVWADVDAIELGGDTAARALDARRIDIVVLAARTPSPSGSWTVVYTDVDGRILTRLPSIAAARRP
jgi:hypothetical protein